MSAMIEVHLDQNGRARGASTYVAGGFITEGTTWSAFVNDWEDALKEKPALEYILAHEAHRLIGQFDGWSTADRDSRLLSFVNLITLHGLVPLRVSVPRATFDGVFRGKTSPRVLDQSWIATYAALDTAKRMLDEQGRSRDRVRFSIATTRGQQRRLARLAWRCFRARFQTRWPEPLFPSRLAPSLQAANLLAWHMRQADDAEANRSRHDEPVWQALNKITPDTFRWTVTEIQDVYDAVVEQRNRGR